MTKRIGKVVIIEPEEPGQCELCGKLAELRPYGPQGENICFKCGMQDEPGTESRMAKLLFGESN